MRTSVSHVDEGTLHAYLDGGLSAAERALLDAHVAECAGCRDRLTEERGLIERADRLLTLAALPANHTHRPVPAPARPLRHRPRFLVPGAWAASIAAAFLIGSLIRPQSSPANYTGHADQLAETSVTDSLAPSLTRDLPATPVPAARLRRATRAPSTVAADSADAASLAIGSVSRQDSTPRPRMAPGVVGRAQQPELRGSTPAPIPPTTVAVTPAPARYLDNLQTGLDRAHAIGTTWTVIAAEPARKALGTDVVRIPGIPVRDILQNPQAPGQVVVEQEVAQGTVIQLLQARLDTAGSELPVAGQAKSVAGNVLQKMVGSLQVRISGPLRTDSLLKLLELAH